MAAKGKKIYVTRRIPDPGVDLLKKEGCELTFWDSDEAIPEEDLINNIKGKEYDALLCMLTDPINKAVLDAAGPSLKVVSTMSVGYEHIDLVECKARGISVCNTPNVSTDSVAELTVGLLLLTARRLIEGVEAVKNGEWGKWKPMWICGIELSQRTVGILGLGRIGFGVARRLKPFGVKEILYHDVVEVSYAADVGATFADFDKFARECDIICICCNLTAQTRDLFNKQTFKKMKNTAVLINTGRGGVINHDDLLDALTAASDGRPDDGIAAAGIDVTVPEPLDADHPLVKLQNCVVLPHMGSNTWDTRNVMSETAGKNIMSVFNAERALGYVC